MQDEGTDPMPRKLPTVQELANEAGMDGDTAALILLMGGLRYDTASQTVWEHDLPRARAALSLPDRRPQHDLLSVGALAARAGMTEEAARRLLAAEGALQKARLKRVPRGLLRRAEQILGIRTITSNSPEPVSADAGSVTPALVSPAPRRSARAKPSRSTWPTIGPPQDIVFLTAGDVRDIHFVLVRDFARTKDPIDPPGVRSEPLLESAVHRPRTALGETDKYPTVSMAASALVHSIVLDHPFHNGNKRTALVSLLAFLDRNGWVLTCDENAVYDFLLSLADHRLLDRDGTCVQGADAEVLHGAYWLQRCVRRVVFHEYPLQFRHLRSILESYQCTLAPARRRGNRVNIARGDLHTQVQYVNEGTDVEKNTVHKIRKELQLDEEHGYDSDIFYNRGPRIPVFINKYRKLLIRLAKV